MPAVPVNPATSTNSVGGMCPCAINRWLTIGSFGGNFVDHRYSDPNNRGEDKFAIANATIGYRLPANAGILSLEVQNLFDEHFHFQNRSIRPDLTAAPRYAPERTIMLRGTIRF